MKCYLFGNVAVTDPARFRPVETYLRLIAAARALAPEAFALLDRPYEFDVGRTPNDHLTFGLGGPHFCLGSALARMELRILFEELLARVEQIRVTGPVTRLRSNFVNGIKTLPVTVTK